MKAPKLRFKADDGSEFPEWEEKKIGDFLNESRIPGHTGKQAKKLTVKLWAKGIVPKESYLQGSEGTQYYVRHAGQLMYGKLDFLNCAFGIVPEELDGYESTIDSPAFDIHGILSDYLLAYITRKEFYKRNGDLANGTRKAKRIQPDVFFDMDINVPSLPEQKKIADFLSTIDEIITTTEAELTARQERKKGVMQKIFNREVRFKADDGSEFPEWEEKRLGEVCDIVGGGTPDTDKAEYWGGDVNWFTPSEIGETKYVVKSNRQISKLGLLKSSAKLLPQGTILLTSRATLGEMAIVKQECCTNQGFQSLIVKQECLNEFIYYYQPVIKRYCEKHASGSTFLEISKKEISGCKLGVPSLPEQRKIAECLSSLDDVINQIDAELSAWKEFKKGLLQQMFV